VGSPHQFLTCAGYARGRSCLILLDPWHATLRSHSRGRCSAGCSSVGRPVGAANSAGLATRPPAGQAHPSQGAREARASDLDGKPPAGRVRASLRGFALLDTGWPSHPCARAMAARARRVQQEGTRRRRTPNRADVSSSSRMASSFAVLIRHLTPRRPPLGGRGAGPLVGPAAGVVSPLQQAYFCSRPAGR
jgi:hypothetical protein